MIASNVSRAILEAAAAAVGVRVSISPLSGSGRRHSVRLELRVPESCRRPSGRRYQDARGDAPYQRESVGYYTAGRRVNAVCWHGFRDFFLAVYDREPEARFVTALAKYRDRADFLATFPATGGVNIGPPIAPVAARDACRCDGGRRDVPEAPERDPVYVPEWAEPLAAREA